jgi:hypothetical protein
MKKNYELFHKGILQYLYRKYKFKKKKNRKYKVVNSKNIIFCIVN